MASSTTTQKVDAIIAAHARIEEVLRDLTDDGIEFDAFTVRLRANHLVIHIDLADRGRSSRAEIERLTARAVA